MDRLRSGWLRACAASLLPVLMVALLAASLSACGFRPRGASGQYQVPFRSIYLAFGDTSPLGTELKRNLRAIDVAIEADPARSEAQFDVLSESRGKSILSLNSQGRVREYLLTYTLTFRVRDARGAELLGPTDIVLKRSLNFNEEQVLAKETEEAMLYRDMQTDLVQQILRRLAAIKPV
jgi:LPS-assembly lipoprotein